MAHFAQLNEENIVTQVIVVNNQELMMDGQENEIKGILFCKSLYGEETKWKQTSYNGNFRKNYAGIGYNYDEQRDAFIPPKPFNSWILNETTCIWEAPVSYPQDEKDYFWNEDNLNWQEIVREV